MENFDDFILNLQLTVYLMVLKIPPNLNGYSYIKSGITKIVKDLSKKHNVNNRLYNEIAEEFNVPKSLIDRSMRHAIKVSVKRNGISDFEKYSSIEFSSENPTPRELISMLSEIAILDKDRFVRDFKEKKNYTTYFND